MPYIHKDLTDAMDIKSQAEEFASHNQKRIQYFGKFVATYISAISIYSTTIVFNFVS